jgi:hypothetical protein
MMAGNNCIGMNDEPAILLGRLAPFRTINLAYRIGGACCNPEAGFIGPHLKIEGEARI